ncbi:AMP-binding protein [Gemmatimonas sp.]|uniref:AMP-binding protein n=1 Tax=Gemmatimonas sp. TaxID=1962908 RepID=UPI003565E0D6
MNNIASLLLHRRSTSADKAFGLVGDPSTFGEVFDVAERASQLLVETGLRPGARAAVIGVNSNAYLQSWMALQLAGIETALINPTYPDNLLAEMLAELEPDVVVWIGSHPSAQLVVGLMEIDATNIETAGLTINGVVQPLPSAVGVELPGLRRHPLDIAGYMHTSGTTGTPKFCAQTHEYFLRLGRFIADTMMLCSNDVVFAPLPLFHINPLGYGVMGALTAGSGVLSASRFSASQFWPDVRTHDVTCLILHAPPVEILKRTGGRSDAAGHKVRSVFFADADFLTDFEIPLGVSAYGSTEAGGLCHVWVWRAGERPELNEGMSRYGGRSRHEVEWRVDQDGQIEIRSSRPGVLFEGYQRRGEMIRPFDDDGWFATGDLGRVDEYGNLVFIERMAESIRVKGEFVPIGYVEEHFAKSLPGVRDVAIWRLPSELVDDDVALYVETDELDAAAIDAAAQALPAFMRPRIIVHVESIPRDDGVGKIRRRQLVDAVEIARVALK